MTDKALLRQTIINLLNDEHGINYAAHEGIIKICVENGWQDILDKTEQDSSDDCYRYFLWEYDAEELKKKCQKG